MICLRPILIRRILARAALALAVLAGGFVALAAQQEPEAKTPETKEPEAAPIDQAARFQEMFDRLAARIDELKTTDDGGLVHLTDLAVARVGVKSLQEDRERFEAERALKLRLWLRLFRVHLERSAAMSPPPSFPLEGLAKANLAERAKILEDDKPNEQRRKLYYALRNPALPMQMAGHVRDCFTLDEAAEVDKIVKEELVTPKLVIKFRDALDSYDWSIRNPYSIAR